MFKLAGNMEKHFEIVKEEKDTEAETTHVKLIEKYNGVPVYGSDRTVALDKNNNVKAFFGQVIPNLENKNIPSTASISEDDAVNIAKLVLRKRLEK